MLIFQRVHKRLIVDRRWIRLTQVAACTSAAVGLLRARLLEHAG